MGNEPQPQYGQPPPEQQPPPPQGYQQPPPAQQPPPGQQPPPQQGYAPPPQPAPKSKGPLIAVIVIVVAIVVVLALVFLFMGGGPSGSGSIVGRWNITSASMEVAGITTSVPMGGSVEFQSDGDVVGSVSGYASGGTWSEVDSNTITWGGINWDYSVSGNSLTLIYDYGQMGVSASLTVHCTKA